MMRLVEALIAGLVIGLGSGAAPGPLLALAIATTLRRGLGAGLLVSCGPLVSDALIITLSVTLVSRLPAAVVTVLSIVGAIVIAAFGIETLRAARSADVARLRESSPPSTATGTARFASHPLVQATALNLLNPAPWIFWITAGSTMLIGFWDVSPPAAVAFLVAFYVGLVGSKALVVAGVAAGRHRLSTSGYRWILGSVGVLLLVLAGSLLVRALA